MKKEILLQDEFVNWLVDIGKCKPSSAKSYCDYINAANRNLGIYINENNEKSSLLALLIIEFSKGNLERIEEIIDDAIDELSTDKIEKKLEKSLKYIKNWKSALNNYKEFLHDYSVVVDVTDDEQDQTEKNDDIIESIPIIAAENLKTRTVRSKGVMDNSKVKYIHTSKDLYDRFHFRIITQDRHYHEIYYPISFIKRYFYYKGEKKFMDTWVKELLHKVTIHLVEGDPIRLNQISKMEIVNGTVHVDHKGVMKMASTNKSDNVTKIPFSVSKLRFIALDHENSLQAIMRDNIDNLKTMQEITSELKKHISSKISNKKYKEAVNRALKSNFINVLNVEKLKAEMALISTLTKLQLMDSRENTSKGKN